eukprot:gene6170-12502_t
MGNQQPGSKSTTKATRDHDKVEVSIPIISSLATESKNVQFSIELSSKGWPKDVTVVHYHVMKATLLLGTESGAVFAYFDGCQFTWPSISGTEVTHIMSLQEDKILVACGDHSLVVLSLPYLHICPSNIVPNTWLESSAGGITSVYFDEYLGRNYVYIGTFEGSFQVIQIFPTFRICEYKITSSELDLSRGMSVSSIATCPKEERYVAIGFDGPFADVGAVVIYDILKRKPYRFYNTSAVTSIAWHHSGDFLFAGTKNGDVLCLYHDKKLVERFWNAAHEHIHRDSTPIIIRNIVWLPSQSSFSSSSSTPYTGCKVVWSIPPTASEEILRFLVIPSIDHSTCNNWMDGTASWLRESDASSSGTNQGSNGVIPSILLLTQKEASMEDSDVRIKQNHISVIRCPRGPFQDWGNTSSNSNSGSEKKDLSDVRMNPAPITTMCGITPSSVPNSLSSTLCTQIPVHQVYIPKPEGDDVAVDTTSTTVGGDGVGWGIGSLNSLSYRSFSSNVQANTKTISSITASAINDFDIVLGCATEPVTPLLRYRALDLSIVIWGISQPKILSASIDNNNMQHGSNIWIPITTLQCASASSRNTRTSIKAPITSITYDPQGSLLLAADGEGSVLLWEMKSKDKSESPRSSSHTATSATSSGATSSFKETCVTDLFVERLHLNVNEVVTSSLVVGEASIILLGCQNGQLYACFDWNMSSKSEVLPVHDVVRAGGNGAIVSLNLGTFWWSGEIVPVVYVTWASGHIAVMYLHTRNLLAYCKGPNTTKTYTISSMKFSAILDENLNPCTIPLDLTPPSSFITDDIIIQEERHNIHNSSPAATLSLPLSSLSNLSVPKTKDMKKIGNSVIKKMKNLEHGIDKGIKKISRQHGITHGLEDDVEATKNTNNEATIPSIPMPSDGPRYLIQAVGGSVLTFDLFKFAITNLNGKFSTMESDAVTILKVSECHLVAVQLVSYIEEASRAWSDPVPCLLCVDYSGLTTIISIKEQEIWYKTPILNGIIGTIQDDVKDGIILSNGNIYLQENNSIIHSIALSSSAYIQPVTTPIRVSPVIAVPPKSYQFHHGRENFILAARNAKKNKTIFSSSGIDLDKIFSKTKEQLEKEDLMGYQDVEVEVEENIVSTRAATKATAKTNQTMSETRQAFEERGERAARVANKTGDLQDAARNYKEQTAELKEKMKQKASRWGLF